MKKTFAIIEIGSNNTKTHIYENDKAIYDNTTTIEFKKNYAKEEKVAKEDLDKLYKLITKVKEYTDEIYVYGCSIFRKLTKEELNNIMKYIDSIRELNSNVILVDKSKEKISEIYNYENYVNGKLVIFQSNLIKESLGLDKLPTKKVNQTMYKLQIDGSKVDGEPIYVLEGEQVELFKKDMQEIAKYINIAKTEYRNVIFPDTYEIKEVLSEVESKSLNLKEEIEEEDTFVVKRTLFDIIKEKICKLFNINVGVNKNQKAFPVYNEKN